jgi:RteC protein
MQPFESACAEMYKAFEAELQKIENGEPEDSEPLSSAITICEEYIQQLRAVVNVHAFENTEQEVHFFKVTKSAFTSRLIYYYYLYELQLKWPVGTKDSQQKYLDKAYRKITRFFHDHQPIYDYYRSGLDHQDNKYFVRKRPDWRIYPDSQVVFADPAFCTLWDQKFATIMAFDKLQGYIRQKQVSILLDIQPGNYQPVKMKWTGTRAELVELIYALHASLSINNGNIMVTEIARFFELHFHLPLDDMHKIYRELRMRKNSRTKYMNKLGEQLSRRMDLDDE